MWNNVYAFDNKTDYLLHTQLDKVTFAKRNVVSQLDSVRKRNASLVHDMWFYLFFIFAPLITSIVGYIFIMLGNLVLRIIFIPFFVIGILGIFLLMPYGLYKLCIGGLMILFNKHGGTMVLFGKIITTYTYKTEENFCLGKLHKLNKYEKQLLKWQKAIKEGKEVPDYPYIENVCDKMDLDYKIKVATLEDPIMKRFGSLFFWLFFVGMILIVIGSWAFVLIRMSSMFTGINIF